MRHLGDTFIKALLEGELKFFLDEVKNHRDILSLEVRDEYVNIYYKGGSLLKIVYKKRGNKGRYYHFKFDANYCKNKDNDVNFKDLDGLDPYDLEAYKKQFDLMKTEMESWFVDNPNPERDYQQDLLMNNPEIVDIEYQIGRGKRFDMLYFKDGKLYIVENKYGNGAIGGKSGLADHYKKICEALENENVKDEMIESVCHISEAKKALGLTDKVIKKDDIKEIEILFLMAEYIHKGDRLSDELGKIDKIIEEKGYTVPASFLFTTKSDVKMDLSKCEGFSALKQRLDKSTNKGLGNDVKNT